LKIISQRPFLIYFLQIIGIAAAYYIAGKLGNLLVIPPSYATVIFPSSGIALASVLLYGKRAGLGVLLGAFLLNASIPVTANDLSESLNSSLITFAISGGATLQAVVGAYLVRRFAGTPSILSNPKNILLFLFYGGFVTALVNATFSVSLFVVAGRMSAEAFLLNWLSWWGGDALGIVLFTPLFLVWFSTENPVWQGRRVAITLPILAMFFLTVMEVFNAGGRVGRFEMMPTADYLIQHRSTNIWLILLVGFSLTTIVIIAALVSAIRRHEVQRLVDHKRRLNQEISEFKIGLDCLTTGVISVDNNRNIIYINNAAISLLRNYETDIRNDLPCFNSTDLIGKNIDLFHKNPAHQAKLLVELKTPIETKIKLAGHILNVKVSPLMNELGQRIGSIAEVINITEKEKRADALVIANTELAFQNTKKAARAAELVIANTELAFQNAEKEARAAELVIANTELAFQNTKKEKRADELALANTELAFQNTEKEKRADELALANTELAFQNAEKEKRADELALANTELAFQNAEKEKRADELVIANTELAFQNAEKEKRADELVIANTELAFQNAEKEKRADELVIANTELAFQNAEKEKRADELVVKAAEKTAVTLELAIANATNLEKEKQANELVSVNKHLIEANEEIAVNLQILAVVNDEKERVAIELANFHVKNALLIRQVNQIQKLESIGRVTSGVAHEFNNILGCIIGYNDMNQYVSEDMTDEGLKMELENNTKQVSFAVKRAAELINKMLVYCRQDTPKTKMDVQPTQVVIENVLTVFRPTLTNQITIETLFSSEKIIRIDVIDLQQILTSLINNARDALKANGGAIAISLKRVTNMNDYCMACATVIEGDFIELSIADNGTGIEPKIISRIFDPFFTTKEQGEGTGLGLSAVSGLVHQSGGHLLVESNQSEINHGTTFKLLFPIPN